MSYDEVIKFATSLLKENTDLLVRIKELENYTENVETADAVNAEREACALACEKIQWSHEAKFFAKTIRARGEV